MTAPTRPTLRLVDHDGRPTTERTHAGSWRFVFFGFTHCRQVCPRALQRLCAVLDELGELADLVRPLYITVDPERDSPEVMKRFLGRYPRFTGLTGSNDAVDAAKVEFRVFARRKDDPDDPGGYSMPGTAITYLLSPEGNYVTHFPDAMPSAEVKARLCSYLTA